MSGMRLPGQRLPPRQLMRLSVTPKILQQMRRYQMRTMLRTIVSVTGAILAFGSLVANPVWAATFSFTTGTADAQLGALSRRASPGNVETETADDFILQQTTVINRATITGLIPSGTALESIKEVE